MAQKSNSGCGLAVVMIALILCLLAGTGYVIFNFIQKLDKAMPTQSRHVTPPPPIEVGPSEAPTAAAPDIITSKDGAFVRDRSLQVKGFYKSQDDVNVGAFKLVALRLGSPGDFLATETNGLSADHEAPFTIVLAKPGPAMATPDLAKPEAIQLVCRRYVVTREAISCDGDDAQFGKLSFRGKISPDFVTKIAVTGDSTAFFDEGAVTGDLTVGKTVVKGLSLAYWKDE